MGDEAAVAPEGLRRGAVNASAGGVESGTAEECAKRRSAEHAPSKGGRMRQSAAEGSASKWIARHLSEGGAEERVIERRASERSVRKEGVVLERRVGVTKHGVEELEGIGEDELRTTGAET